MTNKLTVESKDLNRYKCAVCDANADCACTNFCVEHCPYLGMVDK